MAFPAVEAGFSGYILDGTAANAGLYFYQNGVGIASYGPGGLAESLSESGGYQPVDATLKARMRFKIPTGANAIRQVLLSFSLATFRSGVQSTSAAGAAHSHGFSGGTLTASSAHTHPISLLAGAAINAVSIDAGAALHTAGAAPVTTPTGSDSPAHSHGLSGVTSAAESSHTHALNNPSALYEAGMAQGVTVLVGQSGGTLTDRTSALGGPWGTGSALDVSDLDITQWITASGWWEVQLGSTALGGIFSQVDLKVTMAAL